MCIKSSQAAIFGACIEGHNNLVGFLLDNGAEIDQADSLVLRVNFLFVEISNASKKLAES
jgi:ankyrin repeat protein